MSTRVVSAVHGLTSEDYTFVPSTDEFDELSETVKELSRHVTDVSMSMKAVDRRMDSQDKKLASIVEKMTSVSNVVKATKEEIKTELTNGEWKSALQNLVRDATATFETKLRDAGRFSADKISELIKQEAATCSLVDKIQGLRESASENHNMILKFRMWLTVQTIVILLLTAVVVWLAVK